MKSPADQKPVLTLALIALNVLVFLLVFSMPEALREETFLRLAFSRETAWQAWRWIAALFLHASASHLFFNMVGLYVFGKILEDEVPRQWFLAIYFLAGVLGSFVFLLTSTAFAVGASGAVFGLMGAAMLLNPVRRVHIYLFPLPLGIVAISFTILEALVVALQPAAYAQVANVAHVGGIITGGVFAFFFNPKRSVKGFLVLLLCLLLLLVLGPVFLLITGIGGLVLQAVDLVVGAMLTAAAGALGFLWA